MKLIKISETVSQPHGIGNTWGETIVKRYKCPCGKSTVTTEIETATGFKTVFTTIDCTSCARDYCIINSTSRHWEIVPKNKD